MVQLRVVYLLVLCGQWWLPSLAANFDPSAFDVTFTSPVSTDRGNLPAGNGNVAIQVWVADGTSGSQGDAGDIGIYVNSAEAWTGLVEPFKVTSYFLSLYPPLLTTCQYAQRLKLEEGLIEISDCTGYNVQIFVEQGRDVVWTKITRPTNFSVTAQVVPLRATSLPIANLTDTDNCKPYMAEADMVPDPSLVPAALANASIVYHRSMNTSYVQDLLELQGMAEVYGTNDFANVIENRTFGGSLTGDFLTPVTSSTLESDYLKSTVIKFTALAGQYSTEQDYLQELSSHASASPPTPSSFATAQSSTQSYWRQFWQRSYVNVTTPASPGLGYLVTARYVWQRYLDACDGRSSFAPIKFNGQLFLGAGYTTLPDWRAWGAAFWWQNTRQPYYNTLPAGDLDIHRSLFPMYLRNLPVAKKRTEVYFNHSGALYPETMNLLGLYEPKNWGWDCVGPEGAKGQHVSGNLYIRYHFSGALELILLGLDDYQYTLDEEFFLNTTLPLAREILTFYRLHYPNSRNSKMDIFPANSLETWQCPDLPPQRNNCVTNPTPDIAGLETVLLRLLNLPSHLIPLSDRAFWKQMYLGLPSIPVAPFGNSTIITPGEIFPEYAQNTENTELYTVHPYRRIQYGCKHCDVSLGINTYKERRFPCNVGWCQDVVDAALLGMKSEAGALVIDRAQDPPYPGFLFGGYGSRYQDYEPSLDHLSFMRTAMHWMFLAPMEEDPQRLLLFPTLPDGWDVSFRLHAPNSTVVEASCVNGALESINVVPAARKADIELLGCTK